VAVALADLLADVPARPAAGVDDALRDELRARLDAAATTATTGLGADDLPIRVPKDRLSKVLACEHLASIAGRDAGINETVVRGRVLDRLLHHHVHGLPVTNPVRTPALAIAEGAFEAEREDELCEWLLVESEARQRLADDATAFVEHLDALGPVDPAWWPRCEDRLRVDLAGGRVVCAAQLDLVLGGAPTEHPMVLLEAKSGRFGQDHRDGLFWYALLATLRHATPPVAVIGWSGWDGAGWVQPVTEPLLLGAADRAVEAISRIGSIAGGRVPTRSACRACAWCPERESCPVADPGVGDDD
jgi:hypothetical protein